jgi:hypothetical protein
LTLANLPQLFDPKQTLSDLGRAGPPSILGLLCFGSYYSQRLHLRVLDHFSHLDIGEVRYCCTDTKELAWTDCIHCRRWPFNCFDCGNTKLGETEWLSAVARSAEGISTVAFLMFLAHHQLIHSSPPSCSAPSQAQIVHPACSSPFPASLNAKPLSSSCRPIAPAILEGPGAFATRGWQRLPG